MPYSHVFISRPENESKELASLLSPLGLIPVIQPAFYFSPLDARVLQPEVFDEMERAGSDSLIIFTSPRSVTHGLPQMPRGLLFNSRVAAIGPATSRALAEAGTRVTVTARSGYTSEALLKTLAGESSKNESKKGSAYIVAAPGGRKKLLEGLGESGWNANLLNVYKSQPAELDKAAIDTLKDASGVLSVWTSANAIKALSHRLPPATWFQLCQGDWLVISERLKRLSRAYGPTNIHLSSGPGNQDLLNSVRSLL